MCDGGGAAAAGAPGGSEPTDLHTIVASTPAALGLRAAA
jgi:hypothetical protein